MWIKHINGHPTPTAELKEAVKTIDAASNSIRSLVKEIAIDCIGLKVFDHQINELRDSIIDELGERSARE